MNTSTPQQRFSSHFTALGGPCEFIAWTNGIDDFNAHLKLVKCELSRIENKYSVFKPDSILNMINKHAAQQPTPIDEETYQLLNFANTLWQTSEGKFDATASALIKTWNFKLGIIPSQQQIDHALQRVDWTQVNYDQQYCFINNKNISLNFGGFGKEYAVDCVTTLLTKHHCPHALINLAGDIAVTGKQANNSAWTVGIQHPRQHNSAIRRLRLTQGGIASSGDYERFFIHNNKRYCHIINAQTGYPVQGISSVSVANNSCLVAGSYTSLAMLEEKNAANWLQHNDISALIFDDKINEIKRTV